MENPASFDLKEKTCAEALQAAQKRVRIAFFLALAASCIVLLMVANLWQSLQVRRTALIGHPSPEQQTEYLKEFSKHIADDSFYEIPALGIQITCEDVGILGPLGLLIFSFYCVVAFKGCYCQVSCAVKEEFEKSPIIMALLESEGAGPLPKSMFFILRASLFLPVTACALVILYEVFAHPLHGLEIDPLREILIQNHGMVLFFDFVGIGLALLVFFANYQTFRLSRLTSENCIKRNESSKLKQSAMTTAAATSAHK